MPRTVSSAGILDPALILFSSCLLGDEAVFTAILGHHIACGNLMLCDLVHTCGEATKAGDARDGFQFVGCIRQVPSLEDSTHQVSPGVLRESVLPDFLPFGACHHC